MYLPMADYRVTLSTRRNKTLRVSNWLSLCFSSCFFMHICFKCLRTKLVTGFQKADVIL